MQKYFKCQQCGHRFVAEDDISVQCEKCGSNLLQPLTPRKVQPWVFALAFLSFLVIGFGVSELVQPKLFAKDETASEVQEYVQPETLAEPVDEAAPTEEPVVEPAPTDPTNPSTPTTKPTPQPAQHPSASPSASTTTTTTQPSSRPTVSPSATTPATTQPSTATTSTQPNSQSTVSPLTTTAATPTPAATTPPTPATTPKPGLSPSEVQAIVANGNASSKIASSCPIIVNGTELDYPNFCRGVRNGALKNVKVRSFTCDKQGIVNKVVVTATEKFDED